MSDIEIEEKSDLPKRNKDSSLSKTVKFLNEKIQSAFTSKGIARVAIFTHPCPDPDAIGSQMGMTFILKKVFEHIEVDCFYDGQVSHPQNQRMCNLLDPELKLCDDVDISSYDLTICVDTVPSHAYCPEGTVFDLVIDHHKEVPNGGFKGLFVNLKGGSCCATVYQLMKQYRLNFEEDNDADSKVATALLVGIITDTEHQTSDDTTDLEHEAYRDIFEFRNSAALKQITRYKQPREWVQARACVAQKAHDRIVDGVLIHGIGFISGGNRDLIAAVADEMLSWENVETSVAFAVVDGDRLEGSVRSSNAALSVPTICKELGGQQGEGGGKLGKGGFRYYLDNFKLNDDDDIELKNKMWDFITHKEYKRIFKVIRRE
jgi:nanoRNase/pAp phosphatase (c-di-AMP/oligoRNAs hydrolase)